MNNLLLEDALDALNWQGGTRKQVLDVILAAREVQAERQIAETTGDWLSMSKYLDRLDDCFK